MTIQAKFSIGDFVTHIIAPWDAGVIVSFMVRGQNHSYEVRWPNEREALWHLEFELLPSKSEAIPIGFRENPCTN